MGTEIRNVDKQFGRFQALQKINLEIGEGEFVAILGPSGCGKTTLLRLLAGFDSPTSGEIRMNGIEVARSGFYLPPEKRNIGMVFQSFALWPHMNVREHVRFPLEHHQFLKSELKENVEERIDEVLEMVGLDQHGKRMPGELSGGQKQRVALARAIAPKPSLLLMDEPLSSLDAELRMIMRQEIQNLHRLTRASIVYVTHDQGEALAMADKIVVMNKGQIEQIGTPKEIYSQPTSTFVASFVGKANLVKGEWDGHTFYPMHNKVLKWSDLGVSPELRNKNLYPARPEQLELSSQPNGIKGTITNVQYQGKEIHYTVAVNDEQWIVHQDLSTVYSVNAPVYIHLKDHAKQHYEAKHHSKFA